MRAITPEELDKISAGLKKSNNGTSVLPEVTVTGTAPPPGPNPPYQPPINGGGGGGGGGGDTDPPLALTGPLLEAIVSVYGHFTIPDNFHVQFEHHYEYKNTTTNKEYPSDVPLEINSERQGVGAHTNYQTGNITLFQNSLGGIHDKFFYYHDPHDIKPVAIHEIKNATPYEGAIFALEHELGHVVGKLGSTHKDEGVASYWGVEAINSWKTARYGN